MEFLEFQEFTDCENWKNVEAVVYVYAKYTIINSCKFLWSAELSRFSTDKKTVNLNLSTAINLKFLSSQQ